MGSFIRFRGINTKDCYVCYVCFVLIYPMDPSLPLKKDTFFCPPSCHPKTCIQSSYLDPWIHRVGLHLPLISYVPGSKLLVLGMVIQPLIGNPYNGYINPYYWVDDHPLLYGNNGSLDPGTYTPIIYPGHQGPGEMFQVTNSNPSQNPGHHDGGIFWSRNKVGPRDATL